MAGPVKRSLTVAGHATSLTLEPVFWEALAHAAEEEGASLAGLVARIDAARIRISPPANLASAVRVWLMERILRPSPDAQHGEGDQPQASRGVEPGG